MPIPAPLIISALEIAAAGGTMAGTTGLFLSTKANTQYQSNQSAILNAGAAGLGKAPQNLTPDDEIWIQDAFRHAYASGLLTTAWGSDAARIFDLNELNPYHNTSDQRNMDLWNNYEMRQAASGYTADGLIPLIIYKMQNGDFILNPGDSRVYPGSIISEPEINNLPRHTLDEAFPDGYGEIQDALFPNGLDNPVCSLSDWAREAMSRFSQAENTTSPLVLDLNGDGVKLSLSTGPGSVYFDMDNDGRAEATAWVAGGDGLLALDRNGNGIIDNQNELFGNTSTFANGFANLKSLDGNGDNQITAADAQFANLRVWVDADSDGVTDAGELKTLSSLGHALRGYGNLPDMIQRV